MLEFPGEEMLLEVLLGVGKLSTWGGVWKFKVTGGDGGVDEVRALGGI